MTLTTEIIAQAYRETNLIALGAAPTANQQTEALGRLNALVSAAYGYEVGEALRDWPVGREGIDDMDMRWSWTEWTYPPPNVRLIADSQSAQTVQLPPNPSDGSRMALIDPLGRLSAAPITLDANGRAIEGVPSVIVNADNADRIWFYRAELGNWVLLSTLTGAADEQFPFPQEFDDYFITLLAARLNPRYGRAMNDLSLTTLERTLMKLRSRYRQEVIVYGDPGAAVHTAPGYNYYWLKGWNNPNPRYRSSWMS